MGHLNKSEALRQGIIIFVFLAVLTGLEFFIAVALQAIVLLVVVAIVKAALVMYYYMHIYKLTRETDDEDADRHSLAYKTSSNRLGLWLFLLSDSFVFGGLAVARFNLLAFTRPDLNQLLGLTVTSVLLLSSFFMNRAEVSMENGDNKNFLLFTALTFLLGAGFVAGVVFVEWPTAISEGVTPSASAAGAIFFMMTGMHAFHVLTGLIFLFVVWNNGRRGIYSAEKHWGVEAATIYWHFVDVVWIFFYPALYLIGKLI
ncbi:MAG TPA: cytochrome c oxidase subunit 3 [Anaerolineales bacterium]|jgi:cytochrome c oxidase subunit 3|nr:cytochrome c oxidase subunit 3 [Anaerolineales bacterium]